MTALYAVSAPRFSAAANWVGVMASTPSSALAKPRYSWLVMTPLLPRAPLSAPLASAAAASPALEYSLALTSLTAEVMVRVIFVPVSPSGTGNTLSASTFSRFFSSREVPASTISLSIKPSIVLTSIIIREFLPQKC